MSDGLSRLASETFTGYDAQGVALVYRDDYTNAPLLTEPRDAGTGAGRIAVRLTPPRLLRRVQAPTGR